MESLLKMKVPELKLLLKKRGLKVGGKKADLITRLSGGSDKTEVIDLKDKFTDKNGRLKLGKLIINIHNTLGGDPGHPYIKQVAKQADKLDEESKHNVVDHLEKDVKKAAKKFPTVETVSKKPVAPAFISEKSQALKDKVASELKTIKKSSGFDPDFKARLSGLFA